MFTSLLILCTLRFVKSFDTPENAFKTCVVSPKIKSKPNCLAKCVYEKTGQMDAEGDFNVWQFTDLFRPFLQECYEEVDSDDQCEQINLFEKCIIDAYEEVHLKCKSRVKVSPNNRVAVIPSKLADSYACYQWCLLLQYGVINHKNEINAVELKKYLSKGVFVEEALFKCKKENTQSDQCVKITHTLMCVIKVLNPTYSPTERKCIIRLKMKLDGNGNPDSSDPKMKCLQTCVYETLKMMDANGQFLVNTFNQYFRPAILICQNSVTIKEKCARVQAFLKCIYSKLRELRAKCEIRSKPKRLVSAKPNEKYACAYMCLYKIYGIVNKNDEIDDMGLKNYFVRNAKNVDQTVRSCKANNKQADKCIRIMRTVHCLYDLFFTTLKA